MLDLTELNWALEYNTQAIREYQGSITGYVDLLTQRNNILTMIIEAKEGFKKAV